MDVLQDTKPTYRLTRHSPSCLVINSREVHTHCLLSSEHGILDWQAHSFTSLDDTHIATLIESFAGHSVLLIGTGPKHQFLPMALQIPLIAAKIPFELMSTPAACRTFNALASERRTVLAALLLDGDDANDA